MRKLIPIVLAVLLGCNEQKPVEVKPAPVATCPKNVQWDVHFSPNGWATTAIVANIRAANKSIYVQAYSFTSQPIAEALITAHNRRVQVEVIVDKSQKTAKGSVISLLTSNGVKVFVDERHAIAHNKVIVIDGERVLTGSFNFTNAAEHNNAENSLLLVDEKIAEAYQKNWNAHKEHSNIEE